MGLYYIGRLSEKLILICLCPTHFPFPISFSLPCLPQDNKIEPGNQKDSVGRRRGDGKADREGSEMEDCPRIKYKLEEGKIISFLDIIF